MPYINSHHHVKGVVYVLAMPYAQITLLPQLEISIASNYFAASRRICGIKFYFAWNSKKHSVHKDKHNTNGECVYNIGARRQVVE